MSVKGGTNSQIYGVCLNETFQVFYDCLRSMNEDFLAVRRN